MMQTTQTLAACSRTGTKSGGTETETLSLFYTYLPPIVQRRLPRLPSLRRTASSYTTSYARARSVSDTSITPPPSYRNSFCHSEDGDEDAFQSLPGSRPSSSGGATPTREESRDVEEATGTVRWKFAHHGQTLLNMATREAGSAGESARFSRALYVDSVEYLLKGLPEDLTTEEENGLKAALPSSMRAATAAEIEYETSVPLAGKGRWHANEEPSLLHRFVAQATLQTFLLLSFLIPYIQLLLQEAYAYDRKHRVSKRLVSQGMITAENISKQVLSLANSICAMSDGQVGEMVKDMGVWWVQGISGGLCEGVGEGMLAVGLRDPVNKARIEEQ